MIIQAIFLVQALCCVPHILATNSSAANVTVELSSNVFTSTASQQSQGTISPTKTSTQAPTTSATNNVNSLLEQANKLRDELFKNKPTSGSVPDSGNECDTIDWYSKNKCTDKTTCEIYIENYKKQMSCLGSKPENVSSLELADNLDEAGMKIAEDLMDKVKKGALNNVTSNFVKDNFVLISGVADDKYINNTKDEFLHIPDYSDPSYLTGKWETMRDSIEIPITELKKKAAPFWPYAWSVQDSLVEDRPLKMTEIETDYNGIIKESDVSDLYLDGDVLKSKKKPQSVFMNTNVLSLSFKKTMEGLIDPVLITLRHKKDGLEEPACVYYDKTHSIWSKKGCSVRETNSTHTVCACKHLSMFAVAMREKKVEDLSEREALVIVAIVFGTISLLLLIAAAVCVFYVGYHFVDNMRIALNIDLALILCQLFFFIGLSSEGSKYLATPSTCEVIAPFVHIFELAALTFLLMEALHYLNRFKHVFSKTNTRTFYIYASLGWGIPFAFGCAVAGYSYEHHGSPVRNEFCWMSVYGGDAWYFGAPVLILVLLNLFVRAAVLKEVMAWKGKSNDINIERTKMRLITAVILLPVILLTWLLGVLATNYSEDKAYHYFFVIFHALQGILVFVFYCARNKEMWDYYTEKKTQHTEEKNAVYQFQYVP